MALTVDQVVGTLNDLIETCKDGEQGYQLAAENIQDKELEALLMSYARQRGECAAELQHQVKRLGGRPEQRGSMAGALHRGWLDIRAAVAGHKPEDILAECERGEETAMQTYQDALAKDLPGDIRAMIALQGEKIRDCLDHVRALHRNNQRTRMDKPSFNV